MSEALHTKIIRTADHKRALVLFSGGQDSATCVVWALARCDYVETLGFDYGQRHRVELECREGFRAALMHQFPQWADKLGSDHMIDLSDRKSTRLNSSHQ